MTDLPVSGFFAGDPSNADARAAFASMLAAMREVPGGATIETLTISSGFVTPTRYLVAVDTEGGVGTDDMDRVIVTNHPDGRVLAVTAATGRAIVVKHLVGGDGQVSLRDEADTTLVPNDWLFLYRDGLVWRELCRSPRADRRRITDVAGARTVALADNGRALRYTGATPHTWALPAVATARSGFVLDVWHDGSGALTIDPAGAETVNGQATWNVSSGQHATLICDGASWVFLPTQRGQGVRDVTGTTDTIAPHDRGDLISYNNGVGVAVAMPNATGLPRPWFVDLQNRGAGDVTITPTVSTIDGAATLILRQNQGVRVVSDGTNYLTQRGVGSGAAGSWSIVQRASNYTVLDTDTYKWFLATNPVTLTLPAAPVANQLVAIAHKAPSGAVTIEGNGKFINGNTLLSLTGNGDSVVLGYSSDSDEWSLMNSLPPPTSPTFNNIEYFTSSGSYTAGSGVTRVRVTVIGPGGGGGGGAKSPSSGSWKSATGGGGGGSGGYASGILSVAPGSFHPLIVGLGGAGGGGGGVGGGFSGGTVGDPGSADSSFSSPLLVAGRGLGGAGGISSTANGTVTGAAGGGAGVATGSGTLKNGVTGGHAGAATGASGAALTGGGGGAGAPGVNGSPTTPDDAPSVDRGNNNAGNGGQGSAGQGSAPAGGAGGNISGAAPEVGGGFADGAAARAGGGGGGGGGGGNGYYFGNGSIVGAAGGQYGAGGGGGGGGRSDLAGGAGGAGTNGIVWVEY